VTRPYTKRLVGGTVSKGVLSATCPVGFRWVVRDIAAIGVSGSWIFARVDSPVLYLAEFKCADAGGHYYGHWTGRQVVNGGEVLTIGGNPGGEIIVVTGYEFVD
jgi:hypothetical protein